MTHLKILIFNSEIRTGWQRTKLAQREAKETELMRIIGKKRFSTRQIYLDECFEMERNAIANLFEGIVAAGISARTTITFSEWGVTKEQVNAIDVAATRVIDFCYKNGIPLLGVCYGFQRIASYIGEHVDELSQPELTSATIELTPRGKKHYLFANVPEIFDARESHYRGITAAQKVEVLARSNECIQAIAVPHTKMIGIQFLPYSALPHVEELSSAPVLSRFVETASRKAA